MRKLARIEKISAIEKHNNADSLELYKILGWQVVGRIGEYQKDDLVVYCEVDSWIPHKLAPFLSKGKEPREYEGIEGERLRTVRLRGEFSQGLILPLCVLPEEYINNNDLEEGIDVSELLGIIKYEKALPAALQGQAKSTFPSFLQKSDQERIQSIKEHDYEKLCSLKFQVTEKLDGSSMTVYFKDGEWGVCSRNLELKLDQEGNTFVDTFKELKEKLQTLAENYGYNFALQGELCGPGIQGNQYKLSSFKFFIYNMFSIDTFQYIEPEKTAELVSQAGLLHVPILDCCKDLSDKNLVLTEANGSSALAKTAREGLVYKSLCGQHSFKAISNEWLLKYE